MLTCAHAKATLSAYLDDDLTAQEIADFVAHVESCPECADALSLSENIRETCAHLDDDLQPPDAFKSAWRSSLKQVVRLKRGRMWRGVLYAAAAALIVLASAVAPQYLFNNKTETYEQKQAIAESEVYAAYDMASDEAAYSRSANPPASAPEPSATYGSSTGVLSGAKVLRSADISIDTDAFDSAMAAITDLAGRVAGYISDSSAYGEDGSRSARVSLRVPDERMDWVMERISELGRITYKQISAQDVSSQYFDTDARLNIAKEQRTRINDLYARATAIEDLLRLEQELSRLQYDIDYYSGQIKSWDALSSMPTISVNLREAMPTDRLTVEDDAPLWLRMREAWYATLNGAVNFSRSFVIWLAAAAPVMLFLIPVVILIVLSLRQFILIRRNK